MERSEAKQNKEAMRIAKGETVVDYTYGLNTQVIPASEDRGKGNVLLDEYKG